MGTGLVGQQTSVLLWWLTMGELKSPGNGRVEGNRCVWSLIDLWSDFRPGIAVVSKIYTAQGLQRTL